VSVPRFRVVQKEKKRERVRLELRAAALEVGTFSGCDLVLNDPLAAARHCAFAFADDTFVVRDLGSDTGTYCNGRTVAGEMAVRDGDTVVVGTTRLVAQVSRDDAPTLTLQLTAGDLGYVPSRSGEFQSDADTMARREVDLAKWPGLRRSNRWAARLFVLGLPVLLLWPRAREGLTDPGPLSAAHASLFTAAGSRAFPEMAALAQVQGCGVCHDSFFGATDARCAQCHASLARDQHPFAVAAPDPTRARRSPGAYSCAPCHQEHHGPAPSKPAREVRGELCEGCHAGTSVAAGGYVAKRAPKPVPQADRAYGGFAFAHADHAKVACNGCHRPRDHARVAGAAAAPSRAAADFAPIEFELCAGCHREEHLDPSVPAEWQPRAEHRWTIRWHGSGGGEETCGRCHRPGPGAGGYGPDLRQVPRVVPDADAYAAGRARYAVAPRSHRSLREDPARDCGTCHRDAGLRLGPRDEKTFWHELHLSQPPASLADDAARRLASAECRACHADLAAAAHLTDHALEAYACASAATCGECHREAERGQPDDGALVPVAAPWVRAPMIAASDFPHAEHMDFDQPALARGCFTCHDFEATAEGRFPVPTTRPQAQRCLPCHERHDHVGGGACRRCHGRAAPAYDEFLGDDPPPARRPTERLWPTESAFSHFSPGHQDSTDRDCATCHRGGSSVTELKDLVGLHAPTEADAACRDCHLKERQRYHWR